MYVCINGNTAAKRFDKLQKRKTTTPNYRIERVSVCVCMYTSSAHICTYTYHTPQPNGVCVCGKMSMFCFSYAVRCDTLRQSNHQLQQQNQHYTPTGEQRCRQAGRFNSFDDLLCIQHTCTMCYHARNYRAARGAHTCARLNHRYACQQMHHHISAKCVCACVCVVIRSQACECKNAKHKYIKALILLNWI